MSTSKSTRVCPVENAGGLDNKLRRLIHNPQKILGKYIEPEMTVLDFGCGSGFFTIEMAKMLNGSGKAIAVDLQRGMLDILQKKIAGTALYDKIELHQCSGNQVGILEKVDFILAFYVVHEVPDHDRFFTEIKSILKPGGKILVVEPKFHVDKESFQKMEKTIENKSLKILERPRVIMSRSMLCEL